MLETKEQIVQKENEIKEKGIPSAIYKDNKQDQGEERRHTNTINQVDIS